MHKNRSHLVQGAMVAALYALLTSAQAIILPGSTSAAIQFRISEALMMLTLFSPSMIYGLTIGCCIANIFGGLPIDILIGPIATLIAGLLIYKTRNIKLFGFPILSVIFPALCNGIIIGAEIQIFFVQNNSWISLLIQMALVFIGELAVSVVLGIPFYYAIVKTNFFKNCSRQIK